MTIEELRQKPVGVLETRSITLDESEEYYFLGKKKDGKYFIAFSPQGGGYGSRNVIETDMVKLINNKYMSDNMACDIYFLCPQLSYHSKDYWGFIKKRIEIYSLFLYFNEIEI